MISESIKKLLEISPKISTIKYLCDDFTLDWDRVRSLLSESVPADVLNSSSCLQCKQKIDPILNQTLEVIKCEAFRRTLYEITRWTHSTEELFEIFDDFIKSPDDNAIAATLRISSILEFSLGNVYQTITQQSPPHLLKDLLQELSQVGDIFELHHLFLLQLILGSSNGVNLRNIVWHGFADIIPSQFVSFLFVILTSYGKILNHRSIIARTRPEIFLTIYFDFELHNFDELLNSPTIQKCNLVLWKQILMNAKVKSRQMIFLLLSQIEAVLRFIYGQVNDVDIIAQPDNYYIIMDSIFYEYVLDDDVTPLVIGKINKAQEMQIRRSNRRNRMLEIFPRSLMHIGYDLFHAADGPRIRDKISHGEAVCNCKSVTRKLLQFMSLVVRFYDRGELPTFEYESVYMNNFKLVRDYNVACDALRETFECLNVPKVFTSVKFTANLAPIDSRSLKTFFRPLDETQIVKLLLQILRNFSEALKNFASSCDEFFRLFEARRLGSRSRQTLHHLVAWLPNFHAGFTTLLVVVDGAFTRIQQADDDVDEGKTIKILQQALKFSENLAKHFSATNRNFFVANGKTCEFLKLIDKHKYLFTK